MRWSSSSENEHEPWKDADHERGLDPDGESDENERARVCDGLSDCAPDRGEPLIRCVTGRVSLPDGAPAMGAIVETSAGGRVVAAPDGSFTLVFTLGPGIESVELTARLPGGAGRADSGATVPLVPSALAPTTTLGRLAVEPWDRLRAPWVPTFGEMPGTDGMVLALVAFDDGTGAALFVGGAFLSSRGGDSSLARWGGRRGTRRFP